jgi:peptide/nickel transport system substrate-binding protein
MRRFLLACCLLLLAPLRAQEPIRIQLGSTVSLNPLIVFDEGQNQALDLLFDRLVTMDAKGAFVPQILERWTFSADNRELLLKIRPGLRWHNGEPIVADDLLFTWRLLRTPKMLALADNQAAGIPSLEKVDPLTLRIRLERPRATLLAELYNFIPVPHTYPAVTDPRTHPYNRAPIGSGPYRVAPESTGDRLVLVRWDGYRGPHPGAWPKVEFLLSENRLGTKAVEDGSVDFYESSSWLSYYLVRTGARNYRNVVPIQGMREGFQALWFNCDPKISLLGDARLRKALAELYPWDEISRVRSVWPLQAAGSIWPPDSWAYDSTARPLPRKEMAQTLLDEAGWHRGGDGWRRDTKGRELRLEYIFQQTQVKDPVISSFLAAARECGIRIEERGLPYAQTLEAQIKGQGDIWLVNWTNNGPDPSGDGQLFTTSGIPSGTNFTRYRNPMVDQLFEDGLHATDLEQRILIYRRINQIITADRPLLLLYYLNYFGFRHKRLKGVSYQKRGTVYGFVPGMRGWTLEE